MTPDLDERAGAQADLGIGAVALSGIRVATDGIDDFVLIGGIPGERGQREGTVGIEHLRLLGRDVGMCGGESRTCVEAESGNPNVFLNQRPVSDTLIDRFERGGRLEVGRKAKIRGGQLIVRGSRGVQRGIRHRAGSGSVRSDIALGGWRV